MRTTIAALLAATAIAGCAPGSGGWYRNATSWPPAEQMEAPQQAQPAEADQPQAQIAAEAPAAQRNDPQNPVDSPPPDPYRAAAIAARKQQVDEFLAQARFLLFAEACRVTGVNSTLPVLGALGQRVSGGPHADMDEIRLSEIAEEARQRAKTEGCGFWQANPDAVLAVRQAVSETH